MRAVIAVDHAPEHLAGEISARVNGHPEGIGGQVCARPAVDSPAQDWSADGVDDDPAVELALACRMLGDVNVTQSCFGPSRRNSRRTRAVTVTAPGTLFARRRGGNPVRLARRTRRATVLCPTITPWACTSSAWTRNAP